jgi:hypothetical protein
MDIRIILSFDGMIDLTLNPNDGRPGMRLQNIESSIY